MTVRKVKGEWSFGVKDVYNLDNSLAPIILAGLTKFLENLEHRKSKGGMYGVPNQYMKNEEDWITDSDVGDYFNDIRKMIFAFDYKNEPDISDYDFSFPNWLSSEPDENGNTRVDLTCSNNEERDRYHQDMKEWQEKQKEGLELFGKMFKDLWI